MTQSPPQKGAEPPIFGPCLLWPSGWMDQDGTWHGGRPAQATLCQMGSQPLPKKGAEPPQFSAHVYCGQTARCIKMPLCMEVGSAQATLCQMGRSSPKRGTAPVFGSCLLWRNGWMDENATWYGSTPWPRPHCVRWGPSSPRKGHSSPPPLFGPCLLWPRSPISAAAEFLLHLCNKH